MSYNSPYTYTINGINKNQTRRQCKDFLKGVELWSTINCGL